MAHSQVADEREILQVWRVEGNICNSQQKMGLEMEGTQFFNLKV
jgi:hypothetical protein